jgi:hypothetical protein
MQLIPRYLVKQRTHIVADVAGFATEYRPVYRKEIQIYRGIDNEIQFKLMNTDQKPIDLSSYTTKFVAYDENKNLVIEHDGVQVTSDGSTNIKGVFKVNISENDLLNVKNQFLSYNVYLVDNDSQKILTYTDSHFGIDGTIKISSDAFPGPQATYNITQFTQSDLDSNIFYSETIDAQPGINGNEALHTAAIYTDGYIGDITVQATLDNQVTEGTAWADVQTVSLTGSEDTPVPMNFNGVFSHLRFKSDANPNSTISKILIRN